MDILQHGLCTQALYGKAERETNSVGEKCVAKYALKLIVKDYTAHILCTRRWRTEALFTCWPRLQKDQQKTREGQQKKSYYRYSEQDECQMSDIYNTILRKLAVNDDTVSTRTTTDQVINTFLANIFLLAFLGTVFEIFRRKKSIYLNRYVKRFIETGRVPPAPSKVPFSWIWTVLNVSEHELLDMIGLDGYMCIRYIVVCFRTACFCSIWGVLILVPTYGTAQPPELSEFHGWDRFTIANIPNEEGPRLVAAVFMCYIFSGFFCQLMYIEYKNFVGKRVLYLVNGDRDTPLQTYYTVMVERVPAALRSGPMLAGFFERLYPGKHTFCKLYFVSICLL